jgi:nuclear transport factor 2 (NTF2) superfamily protein
MILIQNAAPPNRRRPSLDLLLDAEDFIDRAHSVLVEARRARRLTPWEHEAKNALLRELWAVRGVRAAVEREAAL